MATPASAPSVGASTAAAPSAAAGAAAAAGAGGAAPAAAAAAAPAAPPAAVVFGEGERRIDPPPWLPHGWHAVERPRASAEHFDRFYYTPDGALRLRSKPCAPARGVLRLRGAVCAAHPNENTTRKHGALFRLF
jgi:hypothetical protein